MSGPLAVVFECDGRLAGGRPYGALLAEALAGRGWSVEVVGRDEPWTDRPGAGLLVVSGGETPVSAREGWMPDRLADLDRLVGRTDPAATPLLGVCLGSQMLAASAAGPEAVRASTTMAVGVEDVVLGDGTTRPVPAFHYEGIDPERLAASGADVLATGRYRTAQAFALGPRILGVQFHPELVADRLAEVVVDHADLIADKGVDPAVVLAEVRARADELARGGWPVVEALWPHLDPV